MNVYLDQYKRKLLSGEFVHFEKDFDIANVVTNINNILMCCGDQYYGTSEFVHLWSHFTGLKEVSMHTHAWCFIIIMFVIKTHAHV